MINHVTIVAQLNSGEHVTVHALTAKEALDELHTVMDDLSRPRETVSERTEPEPAVGEVMMTNSESSYMRYSFTHIDFGRGFEVTANAPVGVDRFGEIKGPNGTWILYCDGTVRYFAH